MPSGAGRDGRRSTSLRRSSAASRKKSVTGPLARRDRRPGGAVAPGGVASRKAAVHPCGVPGCRRSASRLRAMPITRWYGIRPGSGSSAAAPPPPRGRHPHCRRCPRRASVKALSAGCRRRPRHASPPPCAGRLAARSASTTERHSMSAIGPTKLRAGTGTAAPRGRSPAGATAAVLGGAGRGRCRGVKGGSGQAEPFIENSLTRSKERREEWRRRSKRQSFAFPFADRTPATRPIRATKLQT